MQNSYRGAPEVTAKMKSPMKRRLQTSLVFVALVSLCTIYSTNSNAQQSPEVLKTASVCDLFNDLASHSGTRVKVRGLLYASREIFAIGEKTCPTKFVTRYRVLPELQGISGQPTGEYVWPTAIDLTGSSGSPKERGINTDEETVRRATDILTQARAAQRDSNMKVDLWVTVVGLLFVKEHYDVAPDTHGTLLASGYGHEGAYPAQLVIETITDPQLKFTKH